MWILLGCYQELPLQNCISSTTLSRFIEQVSLNYILCKIKLINLSDSFVYVLLILRTFSLLYNLLSDRVLEDIVMRLVRIDKSLKNSTLSYSWCYNYRSLLWTITLIQICPVSYQPLVQPQLMKLIFHFKTLSDTHYQNNYLIIID